MSLRSKIYLDTSVINFLFANDAPELQSITKEFFDGFIKTGIYQCFISDFVVQEINKTGNTDKRNKLLNVLTQYNLEFLPVDELETINMLAGLYIKHKVIPENKFFDALHIAISVAKDMDYLVSWNFKHLANINREKKVLAVNYQNNFFRPIRIITPLELMDNEK
jgi:predicted nucleic acid-binding protein